MTRYQQPIIVEMEEDPHTSEWIRSKGAVARESLLWKCNTCYFLIWQARQWKFISSLTKPSNHEILIFVILIKKHVPYENARG